ncbi:MAG: VOC family protein [Immundisolibacteraceae bacterium]|nr:VOC family protein [Immundisolibacteraceae bacterium]
MADGLALGKFHHISVVVSDIDAAMKGNSRYFGIRQWSVRNFEADRLPGSPDSGFISAVGSSDSFTLELLQPLTPDSPHAAFRSWRGEGMSHAVSRCSPVEAQLLQRQLDQRGIGYSHQLNLDGKVRSLQIDSRPHLSGLGLEVQVDEAGGFDGLPVNRVVNYEFLPILPVDKLYHVGIVVNDRQQAMENFRELLDFPEFLPMDLEVGTSLSSVIYKGESVDHSAQVAFSRANGFCFEIMQPGSGHGAYQEFQQQYGQGMQHFFPTICDQSVFDAAIPQLQDVGVDVTLKGVIDGVMNYYYLSTEQLLGGVTIEVICPHEDAWMEVMGMTPEQGYLIGL